MNKQAKILFIPSSSNGDSFAQNTTINSAYYHRLIQTALTRGINAAEEIESVARQLASIARQAYLARRMDVVQQASQLMLALPISHESRLVALFYDRLCTMEQYGLEGTRHLAELVLEEAMPQHRARALESIGATYYAEGRVDDALPFYLAATKQAAGCDLVTLVQSQCMISVGRSIHGDHRQALDGLEKLFPLVRLAGNQHPPLYYDYLNSLAVELGFVGRLDEAHATLNIALASPFAAAYPNWTETREELEAQRTRATPSIVAISQSPEAAKPAQVQRQPEAQRLRALAIAWPPCAKNCLIEPSLDASRIKLHPVVNSIPLSRTCRSIGPRAPPDCY